ncbi:alpha/beta hydrolase [Bacillus coreaensis]
MNSPMLYELRKPSYIDPNKKYPAIFVMHGMGSNEQNMLPVVEGLDEKFYIFSIRGPLSQPPGFAYFTIQGYGKPHREVFDQAISQLTNFIDYATATYPVDLEYIYLLGFSQGAILSKTLGLTLGKRIKGIVALSGYIPEFVKEEFSSKPLNQLSLFISHGEYDNVLPYEWGLKSNRFFQALDAKVTFKSYTEGHTVSIKNQEDFINWILADLQN